MAISAADVKSLRDKTGAGMMDCKKALLEADGDFAKAERILKELGLAAASKRIGRATNEGRIFTEIGVDKAGALELSCETDFVARNADFVALGEELVADFLDKGTPIDDASVGQRVADAVSKIKENMAVRRFEKIEIGPNETVVDYIHGDTGNIGVVVKLSVGDPALRENPILKNFAFDVALHVAAFNPTYLSGETVDPGYLKEQEEIFTKQAESMGKPEKVVEGIVKGKLKKHLSEICLLEQPFVKDDKRTVAAVAKDIGKEIGTDVNVAEFLYLRVGEELS